MSAAEVAAAALAICLVIIVHEGGHYLMAVWAGMKVDRFSVFGIGPAIVKLGTWRGTEFVIGAIPFGAYVLIRGMEAEEEPPPPGSAPDSDSVNFRDKPLLGRALAIIGGPLSNYIWSILVFLLVFTTFGVRQPPRAIAIASFGETSPARAAGAQAGDEIVRIADLEIDPALRGNDVAPAAVAHRGETVSFVVRRDGEEVELRLAVPNDEKAPPLSVTMEAVDEARADVGFGVAAQAAFTQPFTISWLNLQGFKRVFTGEVSRNDVRGPVGMVETMAKAAAKGVPDFLEVVATISALLGMFNLLPIPALDGGRLTFLAYEAVMRKRPNPQVEEAIHGYGMMLLLVLLLLVTFGDIHRLVQQYFS